MALLVGGLIGGSGGSRFDYYGGTDGRVMHRIRVWAARNCIKAIVVWLSDGVQRTFGIPERNSDSGALRTAEFTFNLGERVTSLSLWGNGIGTRSGWIRFQTSHNRRFDFGMYSWSIRTEYPRSVASGIWVGITGRAGWDIDALGVVFLQPIRSCQLVNVNYPTLPSSATISPTPSSTKSFRVQNTANIDDPSSTEQLTWELADQPLFDATHSWTVLQFPTLSLMQFIDISSMSVQARTPALAIVNNVVVWQISDSDTISSSLSSSTSRSLAWSRTGSILPSNSVTVTAVPFVGSSSLVSFNGSVQVTTTNGSRFSFAGLLGFFGGRSSVINITTSA